MAHAVSANSSSTTSSLMSGTSGGTGTVAPAASAVQEFSVRVPKIEKSMSVMRFNGALNVDISKWASLKMIRDDHGNRVKVNTHFDTAADADVPKFGAGSEYGREAREEARRRKYGGHKKKIKDEDCPWVLKAVTTDKQAKKFKGLREGTISENASYFIFTQATDGQFEAFPVSHWYNFTPVQTYKALTAEEAEEQFGRRDKIMNYFNVMLRKKVKGDEEEEQDKDEEKPGKRRKGGKSSDLKVSEMEDWDDVNEMESDEDNDESGAKKPKAKGKGKGKGKKKGSDSEAEEDSDDGDEEGRELDYISDTSASESENEEDGPAKDDLVGVDQETGLRDLLETDSSEDEEKEGGENENEDEVDGEKGKKSKAPKVLKSKKKGAEGGNQETLSGESDDEDMTEIPNESDAGAKLLAQADKEKLATEAVPEFSEDRKRKAQQAIASASQAKKPKMEVSQALLQSAASEGITEEAVRRYLLRKPMTTIELLQKFKSKKTKVASEDMVTIIASILKKINPTTKKQNNKMYLSLKN